MCAGAPPLINLLWCRQTMKVEVKEYRNRDFEERSRLDVLIATDPGENPRRKTYRNVSVHRELLWFENQFALALPTDWVPIPSLATSHHPRTWPRGHVADFSLHVRQILWSPE
jgi:hypothetical protein